MSKTVARGLERAFNAENFAKNFFPTNVNDAIDALEALSSPKLAKNGQKQLLISLVDDPRDIELIFSSEETAPIEIKQRVQRQIITAYNTDFPTVTNALLTRLQAFCSEPVIQVEIRKRTRQNNKPPQIKP